MNTLARELGITCTADIGLLSIEYTCIDGGEYRRTGYPELYPCIDNLSDCGVSSQRGMRRLSSVSYTHLRLIPNAVTTTSSNTCVSSPRVTFMVCAFVSVIAWEKISFIYFF